jgi:Stress responsive A/B Barrel Domain
MHPPSSALERDFLLAAQDVASIPKMFNFDCLRQISSKNSFDFGLSMEFASQADYDAYNVYPRHVAFVEQRWKLEVADFLEIDYTPISMA